MPTLGQDPELTSRINFNNSHPAQRQSQHRVIRFKFETSIFNHDRIRDENPWFSTKIHNWNLNFSYCFQNFQTFSMWYYKHVGKQTQECSNERIMVMETFPVTSEKNTEKFILKGLENWWFLKIICSIIIISITKKLVTKYSHHNSFGQWTPRLRSQILKSSLLVGFKRITIAYRNHSFDR